MTELARTSRSQQQSQEEDDDVIYNQPLIYACRCTASLASTSPMGRTLLAANIAQKNLKFGSQRHSEGLFWKDPAARGNH